MEWGDQEEWLIKAATSSGHEIPSAIKDKPELNEELRAAWNIFFTLCNTRQAGFGTLQPISFSEMKAYFDLFNVRNEVEELVEYITFLDSEYLTIKNKVKSNVN